MLKQSPWKKFKLIQDSALIYRTSGKAAFCPIKLVQNFGFRNHPLMFVQYSRNCCVKDFIHPRLKFWYVFFVGFGGSGFWSENSLMFVFLELLSSHDYDA